MDAWIQVTNSADAVVSTEDRELAVKTWCFNTGYPKSNIDRKLTPMHRVVMKRMLGRELLTTELVDHINRNTLDNRRCNLRLATASQNSHNTNRRKNALNKYRGVTQHRAGYWDAQIAAGSTSFYIGRFDDIVFAAYMYDQWALALHGEFAVLNVL